MHESRGDGNAKEENQLYRMMGVLQIGEIMDMKKKGDDTWCGCDDV